MIRHVSFYLSFLLIYFIFFLYLYFKSPLNSQNYSSEVNYPPPTPTIISTTTLLTTGDVMLGRSVYTTSMKNNDINYPFRQIQSLLSSADITLINLENPLINPCPNTDTGMKFCAPTDVVSTLQWAGVDVANVANNHTQNYGQDGYLSTVETLTKTGIEISDSQKLSIIKKNNIKFGFIGFDLVTYPKQDQKIITLIQESKNKTDVLVVSFHWGWEYSLTPNSEQQRIAHLAVDSGADLIIGHHPHVVQSIEVYKDIPVIYSHGNLIFDQPWSEETKKGVITKFIFAEKKLKSYETMPVYMENLGQPKISQSINQ